VTATSITVSGVARAYTLVVPQSGTGPFPLVFAFHPGGWTGAAYQTTIGPSLEPAAAGPTIFVYPSALNTVWTDPNGQDTAFFDALFAKIEAQGCVNESRVFSLGASAGGWLTLKLACLRGALLRGVAPLATPDIGWQGPVGACNGHKMPAWMADGNSDGFFPQMIATANAYAATNQCSSSTTPTTPSPCVAYSNCAAGYPVVWCPFAGGHETPGWEWPAIMHFFDSLP
jgi:poly(3-hydroxybutyrate) depolymerase